MEETYRNLKDGEAAKDGGGYSSDLIDAGTELASYIVKCRVVNTHAYMYGLAELLNEFCKAANCDEHYEYDGKDYIIKSI